MYIIYIYMVLSICNGSYDIKVSNERSLLLGIKLRVVS